MKLKIQGHTYHAQFSPHGPCLMVFTSTGHEPLTPKWFRALAPDVRHLDSDELTTLRQRYFAPIRNEREE